ncbi:hypothetical protein NQ318_007366, partial [Aromia moschata]
CASVSDPIRERRQANTTVEESNTIIEVFNDCKCVYYYQCDDENYIITTGETLFNVRIKENVTRVSCVGKFQNELVCCKLRDKTLKTPDVDVPVKKEDVQSAEKMSCGQQRTILKVRIFAGEDELTPIAGEFPWILAIFKKNSAGNLHVPLQKSPDIFKVVLNGQIGLSSIGNNTDDERNILEIIHEPNYYAGGLYNDVSLLVLDQPYATDKQKYINTICLPPNDVQLEGTKCLIAGWGKGETAETPLEADIFEPVALYSEKPQFGNRVMKKVELPFVNFDRCQDLLRQTRLGQYFKLHKSFMCAGGEAGKDACKGDGGSPLMCQFPTDNRYFQMGIVSWGVGCGEANVPGIYANVHKFVGWIKGQLEERGLSI